MNQKTIMLGAGILVICLVLVMTKQTDRPKHTKPTVTTDQNHSVEKRAEPLLADNTWGNSGSDQIAKIVVSDKKLATRRTILVNSVIFETTEGWAPESSLTGQEGSYNRIETENDQMVQTLPEFVPLTNLTGPDPYSKDHSQHASDAQDQAVLAGIPRPSDSSAYLDGPPVPQGVVKKDLPVFIPNNNELSTFGIDYDPYPKNAE